MGKITKKTIIYVLMLMSLVFIVGFTACDGKNDGADSQSNKKYTVHFEICCTDSTNAALDQIIKYGGYIEQPDVQVKGENPNGLRLEGWFEDPDYTVEWDFGLDTVTSNITLYGKWVSYYKVKYFIKNSKLPVYSTDIKSGKKATRCDDHLYGYKIKGYYNSVSFTEGNEFDFTSPVTANTNIYIDVEDYIYFDANSMSKSFRAVAAVSGNGSTAGSISYENKNNESYIRANFGYSTARDPFIVAESLNLDITKSQIIEIKFKNLGKANQLMFYWIVKDKNGNFLFSDDYSSNCSMCYTYSKDQMEMSEDDDWIVLRINLAAGDYSSPDNYWSQASSLYTLRIQSLYKSENSSDLSNELLISHIKGLYDENYDINKTLVTFDFDGVIRKLRIDSGNLISSEKLESLSSGYNVLGYYSDAELTDPVDLSTLTIDEDTVIYVKTGPGFFYDAESMYNEFTVVAATGVGSKAGYVSYNENGYAVVNMGYSVTGDPSYSLLNAGLNISGIKKIYVKIKNLGNANQMAIYWTAKDGNGNYVGSSSGDYTVGSEAWFGLSEANRNMSEDDEWIDICFDLSSNDYWINAIELVNIRIQACYVSENTEDLTNIIYFKEIKGVA